MQALQFIVDSLLSIAELAFLLRLILQWARADFRNELARALVDATNPVLVPLRRLLPSVGRIDTASVVLVLALACARVLAREALAAMPVLPVLPLLLRALLELVRLFLWTGLLSVIGYALLGMILHGAYGVPPFVRLLGSLAEPFLRPFRRLIPSPANLDLSPLWACILIQALLMLLP